MTANNITSLTARKNKILAHASAMAAALLAYEPDQTATQMADDSSDSTPLVALPKRVYTSPLAQALADGSIDNQIEGVPPIASLNEEDATCTKPSGKFSNSEKPFLADAASRDAQQGLTLVVNNSEPLKTSTRRPRTQLKLVGGKPLSKLTFENDELSGVADSILPLDRTGPKPKNRLERLAWDYQLAWEHFSNLDSSTTQQRQDFYTVKSLFKQAMKTHA
ncbi:MAG: hypothetical protein V7708_02820 [Oceanicoccus sp.]